MALNNKQLVRQANENDLLQLNNLVQYETYVHRHLDYRPPLDWINHPPFLILEQEGEIIATLACPPDPPEVSWIRLFVASARHNAFGAWELLINHALGELRENFQPTLASAIPISKWFENFLKKNKFQETYRIVMMDWKGSKPPIMVDTSLASIRPMTINDLPTIQEIDESSFTPIWQNSYTCLAHSFYQSSLATVIEYAEKIVGYQISMVSSVGSHLARLAVVPSFQEKGLGSALLQDLLSRLTHRGIQMLTVNTQKENLASIALYRKAGFMLTGEELPVLICYL